MRSNFKAILILVIAIAAGFIGLPSKFAKATTVSPIRLEYAIDPGGIATGSVKILNDEGTSKDFYISVAKFEAKDDESGEPRFTTVGGGVASWVKIAGKITATPSEFTELPFVISVPPGTEPGGYFAAVFVSTNPPSAPGVISIATDVGTLLFIRVNGDFPEGETLTEFSTKNNQKIFTSLPVEFYYRMTNTGADRIKPVGEITIKNIFGITSKIVNANFSEGSVLPASRRKYDASWITSGGGVEFENVLPKDNPQTFWGNVVWQWKHFAVGRYSAKLGVIINHDSSRSYNKSISFWIIPWQLLLVVFGALFVILSIATIAAILIILMIIRRRQLRE